MDLEIELDWILGLELDWNWNWDCGWGKLGGSKSHQSPVDRNPPGKLQVSLTLWVVCKHSTDETEYRAKEVEKVRKKGAARGHKVSSVAELRLGGANANSSHHLTATRENLFARFPLALVSCFMDRSQGVEYSSYRSTSTSTCLYTKHGEPTGKCLEAYPSTTRPSSGPPPLRAYQRGDPNTVRLCHPVHVRSIPSVTKSELIAELEDDNSRSTRPKMPVSCTVPAEAPHSQVGEEQCRQFMKVRVLRYLKYLRY